MVNRDLFLTRSTPVPAPVNVSDTLSCYAFIFKEQSSDWKRLATTWQLEDWRSQGLRSRGSSRRTRPSPFISTIAGSNRKTPSIHERKREGLLHQMNPRNHLPEVHSTDIGEVSSISVSWLDFLLSTLMCSFTHLVSDQAETEYYPWTISPMTLRGRV